MKTIIKKVLHWLNFAIIALMLLLVVLLSSLHFASTKFAKYQPDIECFVSKLVQHPVQIGEITIGSHGLEPVFRLYHIIIFNKDKTKKLLYADELQVGIDLIGSLFKWQIKPDFLLIRGSEIAVYQNKSGNVTIAGISPVFTATQNDNSMLDDISSWLFEQSRIDLENIALKWHLPEGDIIDLTDLYLQLHNDILQHDLKVSGKFKQQKSPAKFMVNLKLRGDVLRQPRLPLQGTIMLENWLLESDKWHASQGGFFIPMGDVDLSIKRSKIATKLFRQPLNINNLAAKVLWQQDKNGLKVAVNKLKFMDNWLTLVGDSNLFFPQAAKMPIADIQLGIKLTNLAKAKLYYPVKLMPHNAVTWLDQAFVSSKLISGNMVLQGPLDKFPFDHKEGKFLVTTNIREVCLNYDPEWPRVENLTGKMNFSGRSMTIFTRNAKILHEPVKLIKAEIPDLDLPILHIDGAIDTNSAVGLKFVKASPLKNTVGKQTQNINLNGLMKLTLKFAMPLSDDIVDQKTKIDGDIKLYNNQLRPNDWRISVDNLSGDLHFDSDNLVTNNLKGKLFNKPLNIAINTLNSNNKDVVTRINIIGNADVFDLAKAFTIKSSPYINGNFNYKIVLDLHNISQNVFKLHSDLHGIEIKLPEPFSKKIAEVSDFDLIGYFGDNEAANLTINYNEKISGAVAVKNSKTKGFEVVRGEIKLGGGVAKLPTTPGLGITGTLAKFDWSIWKNYFTKSSSDFTAISSGIKKIDLHVGELHVLGEIFKKVALNVQSKQNGWEIACLMPEIEGKIYFPNNKKQFIKAEFKKFYLNDSKQTISTLKPQELLALNLKIDNLRYGDKHFNQVTFINEPLSNGTKINRIAFSGTKFNVEGSGEWLMSENNQNSVFRGKISSNDIGGLLKQWDLTNNVIGGRGVANFILKWPNSPYNPTLQTINGAFSLTIVNGRIINLSRKTESKLGFGKVLNLLSLQSLPRRLALDFSDLTQKGFAFETMSGVCELVGDGKAMVKKLILDGAIAHVEAYGKIGLKEQNYDMVLSVLPHISTSLPAATVGTMIGGLVGGVLGLFADNILSKVTKKISKKMVSYNYHITGSWDKPDVDKI